MALGVNVLVSCGVGLTVTTTLYVVLEQPFELTVYTYVTLTGLGVVLINVSSGSPVPLAAALLIPLTAARVQLNTAPLVPLVGL
jgi:hypothetical protein